jgi:hypothetical protein
MVGAIKQADKAKKHLARRRSEFRRLMRIEIVGGPVFAMAPQLRGAHLVQAAEAIQE